MRMSELKRREVINVCDCKRLGFVGDLDVDPCTGRILAIIVPGPGCVCGFLGREKEFVIPFGDICQIGDDIILVRVEEKKEKPPTATPTRGIWTFTSTRMAAATRDALRNAASAR